MSAVTQYRRYLRLLKLWPTSTESRARFVPCLEKHLTQKVHEQFEHGEIMTLAECERNLDSLDRLQKNIYKTRFARPAEFEMGVWKQGHQQTRKLLDDNFEKLAAKQDRPGLKSIIKSVFKPEQKE